MENVDCVITEEAIKNNPESEVTTSVEKVDLKSKIEEYLKDDKVSETLIAWARLFDERFNSNWFSLEQILKKTPLKNVNQALDIINLIVLKGTAHRKFDEKGVEKFKITLNKADKLKLLEADLRKYDEDVHNRRQMMLRSINELKDQIGHSSEI